MTDRTVNTRAPPVTPSVRVAEDDLGSGDHLWSTSGMHKLTGPGFAGEFDSLEELLAAAEVAFPDPDPVDRAVYPCQLVVSIPLGLDPIERGERFEDPIADALGDLGWMHGGGTFSDTIDGELVTTSIDVVVSVKDVAQALPILRATLRAQGAPVDTVIRQTEPTEAEYPL